MRSIIITGASSGIGAALARRAGLAGWNVLAVARRDDRLRDVARDAHMRTLALDVTAKDAPGRIVTEAVRAFGQIDVVAHLAGVAAPGHLLAQSDSEIERQWQLHVAAPLRISRASLGHVLARHGGFVFIGSGLARVPAAGYGAYASAKAAIRAAAMQLRRELKSDDVFVMYVDPGVVDTEFSLASGMQEQPAWWHGKPENVAAKIFRGIQRRRVRVNASWFQTAGTVLGEWFPSIADAAMETLVTPPAQEIPSPETETETAKHSADSFEDAIASLRNRMAKVKLSPEFVRALLVEGGIVELNDAAMRWAGMPNKNERAALAEVLHALEETGFLEPVSEDRWKVLRTP